jgi:FtsH-binding integral membrane protein
MTKGKRQTIQKPKEKDRQYKDQRKQTDKTKNKGNRQTTTLFPLVIVLSVFFLWSLYCLSFSFGHCIVCLFPLVIVLSVVFLWSLYCLSFSFGHCIVCLFPLVIVLSVFFLYGGVYANFIDIAPK